MDPEPDTDAPAAPSTTWARWWITHAVSLAAITIVAVGIALGSGTTDRLPWLAAIGYPTYVILAFCELAWHFGRWDGAQSWLDATDPRK